MLRIAAVVASVLLGAPFAATGADPDSSARADEPSAALAERLDALVLRAHLGQFWGAVLVARDGEVVLAKGYGLANDSLAPIDARTLFDIGSISKQFTSTLALKLQSAGMLSLDDPVAKHFRGLPEAATRITLRHLLTHTSGLSDENGAIQRLDFPDRDEAVRLAFQSRLVSEPGARFKYCNGGYCIAAALIERVAGRPYQDLVQDELFKPAGLVNTGFLNGAGLDLSNATARMVAGRAGEQRRTILQDGWGWGLRGCGGVLTSLEDLLRWDAALSGDSILDDAARRELFTPVLNDYALGWEVEPSADGGQKVSHGGGTRGYRAHLVRIPTRRVVIAVLTNERHDPTSLANQLLEELLPDELSGLRAELIVNGLTLNQHGAAIFDEGVRIDVHEQLAGDGGPPIWFRIAVECPGPDGPMAAARMTLGAGEARRLAASIRQTLGAKPAGQRTRPGIEATVATRPYMPSDGVISLPSEVRWTVMPRYTGTGDDGKRIVDERLCLVLVDDANSFWPVLLKVARPEAVALADRLDPAPTP